MSTVQKVKKIKGPARPTGEPCPNTRSNLQSAQQQEDATQDRQHHCPIIVLV